MSELTDKVAVVTGAATGIGETIARRLAAAGARVAVVGHDRDGLARLARELGDGRALALEVDVRDHAAMARAIERIVGTLGGLHLAVNNAGTPGPAGTLIADLAVADWDAVIGTSLTGVFVSLKVELPAIVASGGGAIVNLASANGVVGVPGLAAYTAAKHGVIGLTRSAALEYAAHGVRINCVAPGYVATPRMLETPREVLDAMAASHPLGRLATRDEVAEVVAFLLSERASFCTGGVYPIDGGYTAQ